MARATAALGKERGDFELEFGFFIGKGGRNIPKERAREHIFGYSIFNDISARDTQTGEMPGLLGPAKSKDFDTGNIIGPCIATADEMVGVRKTLYAAGFTYVASTLVASVELLYWLAQLGVMGGQSEA